jgi:hypothetical protein
MISDTPATEREAAPSSLEHEIVLLKSEEVASRWRVTRQKINQMRIAGQLKAIRLPSGTLRYDLNEILRLEEPDQGCRQTNKARSAEAIKRGRAKAGCLPGSNRTRMTLKKAANRGWNARRPQRVICGKPHTL